MVGPVNFPFAEETKCGDGDGFQRTLLKVRRLSPLRVFPAYAYLPGRFPHPLRHPAGHSFGVEFEPIVDPAVLDCDAFRWGADLFNHGYYWEAHEVWEALWRASTRHFAQWHLMKGLILLCAAGVKVREGKQIAKERHATRAVKLFSSIVESAADEFEAALGMTVATLAGHAMSVAADLHPADETATPHAVFSFSIGKAS